MKKLFLILGLMSAVGLHGADGAEKPDDAAVLAERFAKGELNIDCEQDENGQFQFYVVDSRGEKRIIPEDNAMVQNIKQAKQEFDKQLKISKERLKLLKQKTAPAFMLEKGSRYFGYKGKVLSNKDQTKAWFFHDNENAAVIELSKNANTWKVEKTLDHDQYFDLLTDKLDDMRPLVAPHHGSSLFFGTFFTLTGLLSLISGAHSLSRIRKEKTKESFVTKKHGAQSKAAQAQSVVVSRLRASGIIGLTLGAIVAGLGMWRFQSGWHGDKIRFEGK